VAFTRPSSHSRGSQPKRPTRAQALKLARKEVAGSEKNKSLSTTELEQRIAKRAAEIETRGF
jgi:hypothetical protein